jgi:hypothetical protein
MWNALKEVQRDTTARPEQLVNLANVIHILTNKPSVWDDPHNEINDWAINHLIDYSFDIKAGTYAAFFFVRNAIVLMV